MADGSHFLGIGWSFPPTFSRGTGSVDMVSDVADIAESLWILFSTTPGERTMLPEYGCDLRQMVFRNLTNTLSTQLREMVRRAIVMWEPRIDVIAVSVTQDATEDGRVLIEVDYSIRGINSRSNLVYPFYLNEATIPQARP